VKLGNHAFYAEVIAADVLHRLSLCTTRTLLTRLEGNNIVREKIATIKGINPALYETIKARVIAVESTLKAEALDPLKEIG
jgi:hypothetical protein